jgi:hypothetical protein
MGMTVTITTYRELKEWLDAFLRSNGLRLMILVGEPGCSKSHTIRAMLDESRHRYIKCARLTAFQLFKLFYMYRDLAIVLDDLPDALNHTDRARLLMNLSETEDLSRMMAWFGTEARLTFRQNGSVVEIPHEFQTTSRVLIVCNDFDILTTKCQALLDRGTVVFFTPSSQEIHRFVAEWFSDKEIYDFVGEHLDRIVNHSIRYYVVAKELKAQGLDWKKVLLASWANESDDVDPETVIDLLLDDPRYKTDKERIEAFTSMCGRHRRQFYNLKKKVMRRRRLRRPTTNPTNNTDRLPEDLDQFLPEDLS